MRHRATEAASSFPRWVALASLGLALTLFFANTVPALREQQGLREVQVELTDLQRRYEDAIRTAALGIGPRTNYDLQSLLVAIDQQGYTPLELCAAHPRATPAEPPSEPVPEATEPDAPNPGATAADPR